MVSQTQLIFVKYTQSGDNNDIEPFQDGEF